MTEKRPRGRPRSENGPDPTRSARIGPTWDEAYALAAERGETMAAFVERALELEIRRVRRVERSPGKEESQ